jgi:Lipase (class 3)
MWSIGCYVLPLLGVSLLSAAGFSAMLGSSYHSPAATAAISAGAKSCLIQLDLFSTRNGQNDEDRTDDEEDDDDEDFAAWVAATLKQWPLLPVEQRQQRSKTAVSEYEEVEEHGLGLSLETLKNVSVAVIDEASFLRSPLSRVLNIETLLRLAQGSNSTEMREKETKEEAAIGGRSNPKTLGLGNFNLSPLDELGSLSTWVAGLRLPSSEAAIGLVQLATARVEAIVSDASSAMSPEIIDVLIRKSSQTVSNETNNELLLVDAAKQIAVDRGLNVSDAAQRAKETADYAASLLKVADGVFRKGYVMGDRVADKQKREKQSLLRDIGTVAGSKALFDSCETATELNALTPTLLKAAEMGALAGAIYEDTLSRARALEQTMVAQGTTADVVWMVTDSIANSNSFSMIEKTADQNSQRGEMVLVRTITIRGFDASDENVDRENLLNRVCSADPVPIKAGSGVFVHSGLLGIARAILKDVKQFIEWTAPSHRLVINGHSIGGSLSVLLLFLIGKEYGTDFVKKRILQVFTFGSPPVSKRKGSKTDVLEGLEIPSSLIQGFVQPWDPIVRLFSEIDALYPLAGDLGVDGVYVATVITSCSAQNMIND